MSNEMVREYPVVSKHKRHKSHSKRSRFGSIARKKAAIGYRDRDLPRIGSAGLANRSRSRISSCSLVIGQPRFCISPLRDLAPKASGPNGPSRDGAEPGGGCEGRSGQHGRRGEGYVRSVYV